MIAGMTSLNKDETKLYQTATHLCCQHVSFINWCWTVNAFFLRALLCYSLTPRNPLKGTRVPRNSSWLLMKPSVSVSNICTLEMELERDLTFWREITVVCLCTFDKGADSILISHSKVIQCKNVHILSKYANSTAAPTTKFPGNPFSQKYWQIFPISPEILTVFSPLCCRWGVHQTFCKINWVESMWLTFENKKEKCAMKNHLLKICKQCTI